LQQSTFAMLDDAVITKPAAPGRAGSIVLLVAAAALLICDCSSCL
jgi:hypothetical protein